MARNSDGTVTVKTPGKLAQTPKSGAGTGKVTPAAAKPSAAVSKVEPIKGRTVVPKNARVAPGGSGGSKK